MIVIGVDPHKATHTAAAVEQATGRVVDALTASAREHGFRRLLQWAAAFGDERLWALEYGRHVAVGLERFLLEHGEQVVRVAPKLMASERKTARSYGKSDMIDALAIARAAIREPDLPVGRFDGPEREIALLVEHRDQLVADHTRIVRRLRWLLHELDPALDPPARSLSNLANVDRLARRLARLEQTAHVRVCRDNLRTIRDLVKRADELKRELAVLVRRHAPALLALPGCGTLTAARRSSATSATSAASRPTRGLPATPASARSTPARADSNATASTGAATASSTAPCTSSPSPSYAPTRPPATTSPDASPTARPPARRCARSSATSSASSTACSPASRPRRRPPSSEPRRCTA